MSPSHRLMKNLTLRAFPAALLIISVVSLTILHTYAAQSYNMGYNLGYHGVPFPGSVISMVSIFNNTGQLTIRITGISFVSDFWSNGTRQATSGFPLNLTAGMVRGVDSLVSIPLNASIGNHQVSSTASWQYSNSSGWFIASPIIVKTTVPVSQTIDSFLSGYVTILLTAVVVVGIVVVMAAFLVIRRRRKAKAVTSSPIISPPNAPTLQR